MFISIILTLIFITILIIYLYLASKRPTLKNLSTLITNLLVLSFSLIMTKLITPLLVNKWSFKLLNKLIDLKDWTSVDTVTLTFKFIFNIFISLGLFYLLLFIFYFLFHVVKRVIFKLVKKTKYKEYQSLNKENKLVNSLISLASFLILSFLMLFPLSCGVKITNYAVKMTNYQLPKNLNNIINNPILKTYSILGSETFFNNLTALKDNNLKSTDELKGISTIALAFLEVKETSAVENNAYIIKEELTRTYIVPSIISEFCRNMAIKWQNGESFMGKTLELPDNPSKKVIIDILDIIATWQKENLIDDLDTIYNLYYLLKDKDVNDIDDIDKLVLALKDEIFTEKLMLELFHNRDFKPLIPSFINFGIDMILDIFNMHGDGNYVNNLNLDKMTDEDIKKEAHNLSLTINELIKIQEYAKENIKEEDIKKIIEEIKIIKESALLNENIYDILSSLVKKLG